MKTKFMAVFLIVTVMVISLVAVPYARSDSPKNNILAHALDIELGRVQPQKYEQPLSAGVMYTLLAATGELDRRAEAAKTAPGQLNPPANATGGCPNRYVGGGNNASTNVKVNQDCSLRRQAEEVIAVNPTNPNNLIAGQNDSRIGYNHCGYAWSFDSGKTWGDQIPPFWSYVLPDGHTSDACSDPTATFDADGNAYVGGVLFDVASAANAIVVVKSNAGIGGRYYHSPATGAFQEYSTNVGVVASGNDPSAALDKEFIVADANQGSPKANNVYATWTLIELTGVGVGIHSPIYFGQSTDGGATWSPGIEISGSSAAYCGLFSGEADPYACDQDQGSHPIVGPDGTIYVAFGNGNLPGAGVEQVLMVSCPASADCSDPVNWTAPAKVGDMFEFHPIGPSSAGCPAGRQCLPPNGYRVPMITSVSASIANNGDLFVSWTDGRNIGENCKVGLVTAETATPPCDSDILYAYSTDGGATWSSSFDLTPAGSAQWQSWSAVTANGKLWVAYYDRSYGNCEFDGCNDITIAGIDNAATESPSIKYTRVTTSSMPNLTLANNPVQAGFLGDYMWVTVNDKGRPLIVWADTRGLNGTVEEDIYFSSLP
jgi:hypothetical protein